MEWGHGEGLDAAVVDGVVEMVEEARHDRGKACRCPARRAVSDPGKHELCGVRQGLGGFGGVAGWRGAIERSDGIDRKSAEIRS